MLNIGPLSLWQGQMVGENLVQLEEKKINNSIIKGKTDQESQRHNKQLLSISCISQPNFLSARLPRWIKQRV